MTFEQWQAMESSNLDSYGNPDALCRSAYNTGRATRDGQFERNVALGQEVLDLTIQLGARVTQVERFVRLMKSIHELSGKGYSKHLAAIQDLINDFEKGFES